MLEVEHHPLKPFLPDGTRLLMLGSFPPSRKRWAMEFFYPNFTNDMWRIYGLCFFDDKLHFVDEVNKTYYKQAIEDFLINKGIGIYDTATSVRRTVGTAADKDLEVVEPTDLDHLLSRIPLCKAVVTTGEKATNVFCEHFKIKPPKVGNSVEFKYDGRLLRLYRMPSSSRAYPMKVERKAEFYKPMFDEIL